MNRRVMCCLVTLCCSLTGQAQAPDSGLVQAPVEAPVPVPVSDEALKAGGEVITLQVFAKITDADKKVITIEVLPCIAYRGDTFIKKPFLAGKYSVKKNELDVFSAQGNERRESFASLHFFQKFQSPTGSSWLLINVKNSAVAGKLSVEMLYQFDARHYGVIPFIGEIEPDKYQEIYRFYTEDGRKLLLKEPPAGTANANTPAKPTMKAYSGPFLKQEGLIPYRKGELWGLCDKNRKMIIPCEYPAIIMNRSGIHLVVGQGKYGFLKPDGDIVYPSGKCYSVTKGRSPGGDAKIIVDMKDADEIIAAFLSKNKPAEPLVRKVPLGIEPAAAAASDLMKLFRENGKVGFKNEWGNVAIPAKYEDGGGFFEGKAAVELNRKWGFIGKQDKEFIPFKFNNAGRFSEGMAAVELNGKWGFINKEGRMVIPCRYLWAGDFNNGLALVETGFMKQGYIDKDGREYWED